jgi:N-acetylmuramoyl-L-alanine amidase
MRAIASALAALMLLVNCAALPEAEPAASRAAADPAASRAAADPAPLPVTAVPAADRACLAEAIYFEARGTSREGQAAVAHVVLNRAESPKFPSSVCGVIADRCQFSYRCNGRSNAPSDRRAHTEALRIAEAVLAGAPDPTNGALFFHSSRVAPGWVNTRRRVGAFGGNIFYR